MPDAGSRYRRANLPELVLSEEVAEALASGRPLEALESAVIGSGLPHPVNRQVAGELEAAVRRNGAVPATICLADGAIRVGVTDELLDRLATPGASRKASTRDLPVLLADRALGATTVAATLFLAHRAGIRILATGGIGGVHPGLVPDISADLVELGRTPGIVVCAGPKTIVDSVATAEALESLGILTVGVGTRALPWFYAPASPASVDHSVEAIEEVAPLAQWRDRLGLSGSLLVTIPIEASFALAPGELRAWEQQAAADARAQGVGGRALTPFLLRRLAELSDGRTLAANRALLLANAGQAARLAVALVRLDSLAVDGARH